MTDITSRSNGSTTHTSSDPSSQTSEGSWLVGGKAPDHSHSATEIVPAPLQANPMASLRAELQELQSKRKLDMVSRRPLLLPSSGLCGACVCYWPVVLWSGPPKSSLRAPVCLLAIRLQKVSARFPAGSVHCSIKGV